MKVVFDYLVPEMYAEYVEEQRKLHEKDDINSAEDKLINQKVVNSNTADILSPIGDVVDNYTISKSDTRESEADHYYSHSDMHGFKDIEKYLDQDLKDFWRPS